jgi:hypothetical protein
MKLRPDQHWGATRGRDRREHGRDTASAAFEYAVTVFELARCTARASAGHGWRGSLLPMGSICPSCQNRNAVVTGSLCAVCLGIIARVS